MHVDLFDFELPPERIALRPARPRDAARMLVLDGRRARSPTAWCATCPACCARGDVLVFNDTRVIPAQLEGRRGEARIGATLHKRDRPAPLAGLHPQRQAAARRRHDRFRRRRHRDGRAAPRRRQLHARLCRRRAGRSAARTRRDDAAAALYRRQAADRRGATAATIRRCSRARTARSPRPPPRCTSRPG